jgi:hypothetical protein
MDTKPREELEGQVVDELPEGVSDADLVEPQEGRIVRAFGDHLTLLDRFRPELWRRTFPPDWITHNRQTAMLISWGAERIARSFGFSWGKPDIERIDRKDEKGEFFVYEVSNTFKCRMPAFGLDFEVWAMGSCSSRNKLYGVRWRTDKDGKRRKMFLPVEEIDQQNVKKHAISASIRAGVGTGLGIRAVPLDRFPESFRRGIIVVDHREGEEGGERRTPSPQAQKAGIDENALRKAVVDCLLDICAGDVDAARAYLERVSTTATQKGVNDTRFLTGPRLVAVHRQIKEDWDKWSASFSQASIVDLEQGEGR